MKLLLDQGLPRSAANLLTTAGIETIYVGEIGLSAATDSEILARAKVDGSIIVTLDTDFHALLALSVADAPSVIRIRIEGLKAQALKDLLLIVLQECQEDPQAGAIVTVDERRIRLRRLPLLQQ
jgi:predicted nuclease of predicted toxin-antitoxin system